MKTVFIPMVLLLALSVPAFAQRNTGDGPPGREGSNGPPGREGTTVGAPGPLVGAGLPVLLIGGGIYWIVRRQRKTKLGS